MKVVLVGLGRMGRNHLRVLKETAGFDLRAVFDVASSPPAELGDVPLVRSMEALDAVDYDCAVIATPTGTHFEVTRALLSKGKHVMVEKPITSTSEQGREIVALAASKGLRLAVGHLERFNPAVRKLREVIAAGWLGQPIHFSFTRVGGYPATLVQGNNVILDLAAHDIDVLRSLVGSVKLEASLCHSVWQPGVTDTAEIFLRTKAGPSASIHVNWVTPTKIRGIRVTGTKGVAFIDYIVQSCELFGGSLLPRPVPSTSTFDTIQEHYRAPDKVQFGVVKEEPLRAQAAQLVRYFERGEAGELCLAEDALAAVIVAEQAVSNGAGTTTTKASDAAAWI